MHRITLYRSLITLFMFFLSASSVFASDENVQNEGDHKKAIIYLSTQIESLEQQNEALSKTINDLRKNLKGSDSSKEIDPSIQGLIEENNRLSNLLKKKSSENLSKEIEYLKKKVEQLEIKNADLQKSLDKTLELSKRSHDVYISRNDNVSRNDNKLTHQPTSILTNKLAKLKRENDELKGELAHYKNNPEETNNNISPPKCHYIADSDAVKLLKEQNNSLRATIAAQNKMLVAEDNASNAAERLLTENLILQRKIDKLKKERLYKGKTAKEFFVQNEALKKEIVKRDNYINKMQLLQNMNSQSSKINDDKASEFIDGLCTKDKLEVLLDRNKKLEDDLKTERDISVSYRKKIYEYQAKIKKLQSSLSKVDDGL